MFINNNDMELVIYDSINQFHTTLKKPHISGRDNSSEDRGNSEWYGTSTYEEAHNLMRYGDSEALKRMKELKFKTDELFTRSVTRTKTKNDVVGFQPIVPNAILGLPQSMINTNIVKRKKKIVDICMNHSWSAGTDKDKIDEVGAMALSIVDHLEQDGYGVNLYIGKISRHGGRSHGFIVKIKDSRQPLNLLKVSYYLGNSSFLRRTAFKIMEVEDRLSDCTPGYGRASHYDVHRENIQKYVNPNMMIIDKDIVNGDSSTEGILNKFKKLIQNVVH